MINFIQKYLDNSKSPVLKYGALKYVLQIYNICGKIATVTERQAYALYVKV